MNSHRQYFVGFGLDFDHREFQANCGGFGSLFVLGAEPRGLRELWTGRGAVHQDGGTRFDFCCVGLVI